MTRAPMIRGVKGADLIELTSFGLAGLSAMAVHFAAAIAAIEWLDLPIWLANILAFLMAVPLSYLGHSILTFSAARYGRKGHATGRSTRRFLVVALSGFALNQASVLILTYQFAVAQRVAVPVTLVGVAALLYPSSKFWAYPDTRSASAPGLAGEAVSLKPCQAARRP